MEYNYNIALEYILANWFDGDETTGIVTDGDDETRAMMAAVDALSRQIPIKPYYRREEDTEGQACPNCDGGVTADYGRIRDTYCSHCGQMIDWDMAVATLDEEDD